MKSAVVPKGSQRQGGSCSATTGPQEQSNRQSGRTSSGTSRLSPAKLLGDPEKRELKEKYYNWITALIHHLDPKGYVEEINSFRHFGENTKSFALEIIAIIDWGRKYVDAGFCYPIPVFPHYLFNKFAGSWQGGGQVPNKPNHLVQARGDIQAKCMKAWIWMASILQFWTDEVSIADGEMFGGQIRLASALAEYVMSTMNPVLEPGYKVSLDHIINRTPWMTKRLFNTTSEEDRWIQHQPIPVVGILSKLKVTMEKCYSEHMLDTAAQEKKKASQEKPDAKPSLATKPSRSKTLGRGETIKIHLKKVVQGLGWTHIPPKDLGPDVGNQYKLPRCQDDAGASQAGHSPLTNELLTLEENVSDILDYENDVRQEDPEIAQAVTHIPKPTDDADVEMEEENPTPGFEPEFSHSSYDINLVRPSDDTAPGAVSPVTA